MLITPGYNIFLKLTGFLLQMKKNGDKRVSTMKKRKKINQLKLFDGHCMFDLNNATAIQTIDNTNEVFKA